jgi:hypothetical protein
LLAVLVVLSLGVATVAGVLMMREREQRLARERELQIVLAENTDLTTRLQDAVSARQRTETELTQVREELSGTQDQLQEARAAQEALSRSVEDREREIARLRGELAQGATERAELEGKLAELLEDQQTMEFQVAQLEEAKGELELKLAELSARPTVELEKVLVAGGGPEASGQPAGAPPIPEGEIIVVNREYDFIVMNLGRSHGLSEGQEFRVVRGDEVLGTVKVEKIYNELSAAAILPTSRKDQIREGDIVRAL